MVQICPKCDHVRKATDEAPEWQCPSCRVVYAKAHDAPRSAHWQSPAVVVRPRQPGSRVLWIVMAATVGIAGAMAKPWRAAERTNGVSTAAIGQPHVILYGTSWCGYCAASRKFFTAHRIRFTDVDIEKSSQGRADYERIGGQGGVPLIAVGDEVVKGYAEDHLRELLGSWLR